MTEPAFELYAFWRSSATFRVRVALNLKGLKAREILIDLDAGEQLSADFLAVNPEGKTPALLIDGRLLTEVAGILYYLARAYPAARLMPANDPEAEAHVVSWMSFIASTVHPARRQGLEHAMGVYRLADERLGDREWAVGDYSIADIHLFRLFWRFAGSLNPPPGAFPNLQAHHDRMLARPAVIRTIETEAAIGYELPG